MHLWYNILSPTQAQNHNLICAFMLCCGEQSKWWRYGTENIQVKTVDRFVLPKNQLKNGQKTWIDISSRKMYRWPTSTWKKAQHHWLLEKCKSKLPRDNHLTPVRCPSLISPQKTNAGEDVEKREPSCTVGRNVSWYNHYGEWYGETLENYT